METTTLLTVAAFIFGTSGFLIKVPTTPLRPRIGPEGWVHVQKLILPLFENVCEDSTNPIIVRLAKEFNIDSTTADFLPPEVTTELKNLITKGFLPKGEIFTDYNIDHLNELKTIYDVFFYAKNFDTFYNAAAWARQNLNCGLFVRAVYLAIINRRDTEKLSIPAPYELLPNYFILKDVIIKASALMSGEELGPSEAVRDEGNSYILDANYTADLFDNDYESKLSYFHEDVGLNTFYFLQKLKRSPWFNRNPDINTGYGEYLYHFMKQLAARYDLERYANDFSEIQRIDLDTFKATPYDPMTIYSNGKDFGCRTTVLDISSNIETLKAIENNLASVVIHMRDTGYNKTQILNHLMEILVTGENSYENLLRASIGKDKTFDQSQPSVLDHYLTSLRDPMFWSVNKKIVDLVNLCLKQLPPYTRNELYFPGVEILSIDVKKMVTNIDYFQFDVTEALKNDATNTAFQVKIGQPRLNNKPFVLKLNVSSLVSQKGYVKIFLGPKVAPGELTTNKDLFMLLDSFECNLKLGSNVITRTSEEIMNLADDFISLKTLRKNVEDAEFGLDALPLKNIESLLGFPRRLILPKGKVNGLPLQIFAIVAPFVKTGFSGIVPINSLEFNSALQSPGYPLDLSVDDAQLLSLPNTFVKDVLITHKGDKLTNYGGSGVTKKWSKDTKEYDLETRGPYDPTSRGNYDSISNSKYTVNNGLFDFNAKKDQYSRKEQSFLMKDGYASKAYNTKEKGTTTTTTEINEIPELDTNKYENKSNDEAHNNEIYLTDSSNLIEPVDDDDTQTYSMRVRKPTVYDYIFSTGDYIDDYDRKIYE